MNNIEILENNEAIPIDLKNYFSTESDAIERANIDSQVATAKKYPRNVRRCIENSVVMATMNMKTAESCSYAIPRGGKIISGPSIHLAKIIISSWENIRAEAKVIQITDTQVVSRGTCWDLENNVAYAIENRRSIINSAGKRFTEDMIVVTGNAANSIALRNAIFATIPKAVTERVYQSAQNMITGDLSDVDKLLKARTNILNNFKNNYNITEEEVVKLCGKQTVNQINADEIALLIGIAQSLKDGDSSVNDLMKPIRGKKEEIKEKKKTMKSKSKHVMP